MATTSKNRYSRDEPRYVVLARRIRGSFLLSFATLGLGFLFVVGPLLALAGIPEVSGIFAATGLIIFFINLLGYAAYKAMERVY